ncbi:MAG: sulfatase-like hydrolase/transferase, partial [Planctomycetaceae bacterium]|nr:sulfatase-like hydrolase/transferase [Planctomycetaceae bacterium]
MRRSVSLRSVFLHALTLLCLYSCSFMSSTALAERPNIVLILIDDLGWPHLGCYDPSGYYESPEIDAVARQGCRFTDFYAAGAVCSPTRASIQSGQYQARLEITDFIAGHPHPFAKLIVPRIRGELPLEVVTP